MAAAAQEEASPRATDPIRGVPGEAKPLRILLFVLTIVSLVAALFLEPRLAKRIETGTLGANWLFLPVGVYGVFFLVYAVDRWLMVKRRRYPAGRAFFQIAFGATFALLLLPSTMRDWSTKRPQGMARMLRHPDSDVRVVAVEALGYRGPSPERAADLVARLDDKDVRVQVAAATVLAGWSGASASDHEALRAWVAAGARTAAPKQTATSTSPVPAGERR